MASTVLLPQGTYPIGSRTLGPASVPQGVTGFSLQLDGTTMTDPALTIAVLVDLSLDGGTTWASDAPGPATNPFPVSCGLQGGATDKSGAPLAVYQLGVNGIPSSGSTTRRIRATVTIAGTPLTTSGTLVTVP